MFNGRNCCFLPAISRLSRADPDASPLQCPIEAWRNGDLSGVASRIYDPATRIQNGATITAQPFAGNIIPKARINDLSTKYYEFMPLPNTNPGAVAGNYLLSAAKPTDRDQFLQRIDFVESAGCGSDVTVGPSIARSSGREAKRLSLATKVNQWMISNTRVVSPSRLTGSLWLQPFFNTTGPELAFQRNVVTVQHGQVVATTPSGWASGATIAGGYNFGGAPACLPTNHTFQWVDNFSWIRARHSFRFGAEVRRDRFNQIGNQFLSPQFNFDPLGTLNPESPNGTGLGFGDYLLGLVRQSQFALTAANAQFRATSMAFYIDDTWKVNTKLTINVGLRYENTPPWFDRTGTIMNLAIPDWIRGQSNVADPNCTPL